MKINIPTADILRRKGFTKLTIKEKSTETAVQNFLNGKVRDEMNEAIENDHDSVNTEVPIEAYGNEKFFELAIDEMTKLGYHAEQSHDGGGMYSTLFVSWQFMKTNRGPRRKKA